MKPTEAGSSRRGERTRQTLLDAAEKLFAEKGFYGVTVRAIAREADSRPGIWWRIISAASASLFDAVLLRRAEKLNQSGLTGWKQCEREAGPQWPERRRYHRRLHRTASGSLCERRAWLEELFRADRTGHQLPGMGRRDDGEIFRPHRAPVYGIACAAPCPTPRRKSSSGAITSCPARWSSPSPKPGVLIRSPAGCAAPRIWIGGSQTLAALRRRRLPPPVRRTPRSNADTPNSRPPQ
jgi:AcrR family transcriptional regulator